ncbi:MFS transporter [Actinomadura rupiterrae]|uniref:MFS transporter n=1 Tax=Actinomadura rupiterrae TaxID=559627 RepID=UPI0020A3A959|nr:MFS transporter [Actinomadura rupiterrae]MCP2343106.1 DHA2 family methylenomycin A resistance protein-like MFS transporter [Actinomadura rupiterrae]
MGSPTEIRTETREIDGGRARRGAALAVVCAGMFLVLLDVTIVNVTLPGIGRALGTGVAGMQGVVDGYAVAIAGLLLGGGALGDRLGHRRMLVAGLLLFGAASLACGLAAGPVSLVAARAVQGAGAAMLLPGSLAAVTRMFPDPGEQARAMGAWAAVSSTALPAGPLLGGVLVDGPGWRWIFLLNVPIVVAAVAGVLLLVPRDPAGGRQHRRLDAAGLVLAPVTLGALVWAVIELGHGDRSGALAAAVAAAAGAVALVLVERRAADPLFPSGLVRAPAFLGANGASLVMNLVTNGTLFVVTLWLQQVQGRSALAAGALLLPMAVPLVLLAPLSGALNARFGPRLPVRTGIVIALCGTPALLFTGPHSPYAVLLPTLVLIGIGDGLITASAVSAAMRTAPPALAGLAGGFNNTARQVGTALGAAIFGSVAGSPLDGAAFASGLHILAWVSAALWLAALAGTSLIRL